LEMAAPEDAARLRAGIGRADSNVEELRAIIRRSGALDATRAEADRLCQQALRALESRAIPALAAERLREIANYAVQRAG